MNKKKNKISSEAMDFLTHYNWQGNVRELENAIERAVVVSKSEVIQREDLPFQISNGNNYFNSTDKSLETLEKKHIALILNEHEWNISRSAKILGIDRVTLYNKITKYDLKR
jgi:DNA-binding NtrC family response regulator